jgi:hypothetical protein
LRGILLRSVLMGLALIPARASGLVLFFHWINRLTGRMSLETDCMGYRNVHRLFGVIHKARFTCQIFSFVPWRLNSLGSILSLVPRGPVIQ